MGRIKNADLQRTEASLPQIRLGDLPDSAPGVFCWCNRCGHNAILVKAVLVSQFGPAFPVPEIGTRIQCPGCGSKDVATRPEGPLETILPTARPVALPVATQRTASTTPPLTSDQFQGNRRGIPHTTSCVPKNDPIRTGFAAA